MPSPTPNHRRDLLILLSLWLAIFAASLFSPPLLDDADATHAQAAQSMATTGDWVTLHVNGIRYLEKPPLPYWLAAISFRLFGFNTFALHLPLALAALALAALGYRWAHQAFDQRTAFYTALATLTSAGVFLFTRIFIPEVLLSLFLCLALYAFLRSLTPPTIPPSVPCTLNPEPCLYPYLLWTALALAVLTKGLIALVFFFGTAAIYLTLTKNWRNTRRLRPITGIALFLLIAAPWHILAGLRNTGGENGHGFFWFYFINEHVLRFLGRRLPHDYNKLPGYLYWSLHLIWLFPWSLFFPLALTTAWRKKSKLNNTALLLTIYSTLILIFFSLSTNQEYYTFPAYLPLLLLTSAGLASTEQKLIADSSQLTAVTPPTTTALNHSTKKLRTGNSKLATVTSPPATAFNRSTAKLTTNNSQRTSVPTDNPQPTTDNLLLAAHTAFTAIGLAVAAALAIGLWSSRHFPYAPDIGSLLAHRNVGGYTLSMSHFFDLTGPSFAALRLPATIALIAFAFGPTVALILRRKHNHRASTITIALTSALFLIAAHIALGRFAPLLSSKTFADKIQSVITIEPTTEVLLFGDQSFGSSIPFYLGHPVKLVDGRSTSMLFGSTFPDAPGIFLTSQQLTTQWGHGPRKILFIPEENRTTATNLLGPNQVTLEEVSGKLLITDRPLNGVPR